MEDTRVAADHPPTVEEQFANDLLHYSIEMHCSKDPDFVKKYGAKVKAAGGSYSAVRGHESTRFVHLSCANVGLINAIWKDFGEIENAKGTGTMIARIEGAQNMPAWVAVHQIHLSDANPAAALRIKLARSLLSAREREVSGHDQPFTNAEKATHLAAKKAADDKHKVAEKAEAISAVGAVWALCMTEEGREKLADAIVSCGMGEELTRVAKAALGMVQS